MENTPARKSAPTRLKACFKKVFQRHRSGQVSPRAAASPAPPIPESTANQDHTAITNEDPHSSGNADLIRANSEGQQPFGAVNGSVTTIENFDPLTLHNSALDDLSSRHRQVIQKYIDESDTNTKALEKVIAQTEHARTQCEKRMWTCKIGDQEFKLRDFADKVISCLNRFKFVGTIVSTIDPVHIGLPWAGLRFLITVAGSDKNNLSYVLMGINYTLHICQRMDSYYEILQDLPPSKHRKYVEKSMTTLLACVYSFLADAIVTYEQQTVTRILRAVLSAESHDSFESECSSLIGRVEEDLRFCERDLAVSDRLEAGDWRKQIDVKISALDKIEFLPLSINFIQEQMLLSQMPVAFGAAWDSRENEHSPECLAETRVGVLSQISAWANQADGESVYWLCGMAGTGKSTVAKTVARQFQDNQQLAASFFFKRGEGDRKDASKFFTTITYQLARMVPGVKTPIMDLLRREPDIPRKTLAEQFEKLIRQPLQQTTTVSPHGRPYIIVIDALDECDAEIDARLLLTRLFQLSTTGSVSFRIFITSRPEAFLERVFDNISRDVHRDVKLHNIEDSIIKHDIDLYFRHELTKIRIDHSLPQQWPGDRVIEDLVSMAQPLFIFAATVCRQLNDPNWHPQQSLKTILKYRLEASELNRTYLPAFEKLQEGQSYAKLDKLVEQFRGIIGPIILLFDPLPVSSLARFLQKGVDDVWAMLRPLHPVLDIPNEADMSQPVRPLHLSFRDYLVDVRSRGKHPFWIDDCQTHSVLAEKCVVLLMEANLLRRDLLHVRAPGAFRKDFSMKAIHEKLSPEVRYACSYWVYHLQLSKCPITEGSVIIAFLQTKLIFWIEALAWLDKAHEALVMTQILIECIKVDRDSELTQLLLDTRRFLQYFVHLIDEAPLQLYAAGLIFTPSKSEFRRCFEGERYEILRELPIMEQDWSRGVVSLTGIHENIQSLTFWHNDQRLSSVDRNGTVRSWNVLKLQEMPMYHLYRREDERSMRSMASTNIFAAIVDDLSEGVPALRLRDHTLSHSGRVLVHSDETGVAMCDMVNGEEIWKMEKYEYHGTDIVMSTNGQYFADLGFRDSWYSISVFNAETGEAVREWYEKSKVSIRSLAIEAYSSTNVLVAHAIQDGLFHVWDVLSGKHIHTLQTCADDRSFRVMKFCPTRKQLVTMTKPQGLQIWDILSGLELWSDQLEGWTSPFLREQMEYTADGRLLAVTSKSWCGVYNAVNGQRLFQVPMETAVGLMSFSRDGQTLAFWAEEQILLYNVPIRSDSAHEPVGGICGLLLEEGHPSLPLDSAKEAADTEFPGKKRHEPKSLDGQCIVSQPVIGHDRTSSLLKDGTLIISSTSTGVERGRVQSAGVPLSGIVFSADYRVATWAQHMVDQDGIWLRAIRLEDGGCCDMFLADRGSSERPVQVHLALSYAGDLLASHCDLGDERSISVYHSHSGHRVVSLSLSANSSIVSMAISSRHEVVACALRDSTVLLWKYRVTGPVLPEICKVKLQRSLTFSQDGEWMAGECDGTVKAYNLSTHEEVWRETNFKFSSLNFSPSGKDLYVSVGRFSAKEDGTTGDSLDSRSRFSYDAKGSWIEADGIRLLWVPRDTNAQIVHLETGTFASNWKTRTTSILRLNEDFINGSL